MSRPLPVNGAGPRHCSLCGRAADAEAEGDPPLGWSADRAEGAEGAVRWICPQCTRRYVRAIEAKLDQAWW
ncbi:hypothetical protein SAMN05443575_0961 [Jatrophihabitans endophyticus]|uniref:Uncharacterized protein n=1 Tax=Jatrophihabitans endophyticus TaxID=1206085 RepID=A0A1M5EPK0_9ACTN|nr:hypothetical protein [Jatrophihabitans endophyticus]SHF81223.1 hypothetical protein SAMN05443575_0961 [Jatrophihabitans endophyticus]